MFFFLQNILKEGEINTFRELASYYHPTIKFVAKITFQDTCVLCAPALQTDKKNITLNVIFLRKA